MVRKMEKVRCPRCLGFGILYNAETGPYRCGKCEGDSFVEKMVVDDERIPQVSVE